MKEKEFCLLEEPWIRVLRQDCTVEEVSLVDALVRAHTFRALAGELPTQDAAMLRMLLAVLYAVFARTREAGGAEPLADADDALRRWQTLWEGGRFPEQPIRAYLESYRERFYLFHPERPFWQAKAAEAATVYQIKTLNGLISESNNKQSLFSPRAGKYKEELNYAEAARWLIYTNAYDNSSLKATKGVEKGEGAEESIGPGWLAKLGEAEARGETLFETLMLNFIPLNVDGEELWEEEPPIWEKEEGVVRQRCKIACPKHPAALLTLQSRRLLLVRDDDKVVGFHRMHGDFFDSRNALIEQMTFWRYSKRELAYFPQVHDSSKQVWREFATLLKNEDFQKIPGVVQWQMYLKNEMGDILPRERITHFAFNSVDFDSKKSSITEIYHDELSFHLEILLQFWKDWRLLICGEVDVIEKVAACINNFEINIWKANGIAKKDLDRRMSKKWLQTKFYYAVDVPFRQWLAQLAPKEEGKTLTEYREIWRKMEKEIVEIIGKEATQEMLPCAFLRKKDTKGKWRYSLPEAYNQFQYQIKQLLG